MQRENKRLSWRIMGKCGDHFALVVKVDFNLLMGVPLELRPE